jgi:4-hydroxy-tetrahydrodipicolinate reductase
MSEKLRIALIGAAGRMGQAISGMGAAEGVEVIAKFDLGDPIVGRDADVLVDFSSPAAVEDVCAAAMKSHTPLVIGTTGHSAKQRQRIDAAAQTIPVVLASNFSVGVNALFSLTEQAGRILGENFDVEIIESHHRMKKDAPSGTAKTLAEILQRLRDAGMANGGRDLSGGPLSPRTAAATASGSAEPSMLRHGREGMMGERSRSEIGIHSVRGGDLVGDHTVIFAGDGERLELTHRASSRETFARGALRAARWLTGKPAGLYSMRDVLGL